MIKKIFFKVTTLEKHNIESYRYLNQITWDIDYLYEYVKDNNITANRLRNSWIFGNGAGSIIILDPEDQEQIALELLDLIYEVISGEEPNFFDPIISEEETGSLFNAKPEQAREEIKSGTHSKQYNVLYQYYNYKYEIIEVA